MTYKEFINNILQSRGRFNCGNEYHERHHIIPKCKNGSDDNTNLIDLFAREHFIAHKLLAEEYPDDDQLAHAYTLMAFVKDSRQKRYELTPEEYEDARKIYFERFSGSRNPASRLVIRLCDDKIYDTVKDCYNDNNISNTTMYDMLKQHRKFVYYDEWINMSEHERQSSQSTREKISFAKKGKYGTNIYCPELDGTFITIKEASDKYGINTTSIGYCLCGKQKHDGKHPVTGDKLSWVKLENKNC